MLHIAFDPCLLCTNLKKSVRNFEEKTHSLVFFSVDIIFSKSHKMQSQHGKNEKKITEQKRNCGYRKF